MPEVKPLSVPTKIKCPSCGNIDKFEVLRSSLFQRSRGALLKDAHKDLPEHRQLQLVDHKCLACRKKEGYAAIG
jgi:hypothetical protein